MSELAMNALGFGEEPGSLEKTRRTPPAGDSPRDPRSVLVSEDVFLRMLCLERKRAERSRKPFLLLLLDSGGLLKGSLKNKLLAKLVAGLSASMRETDVCGWYEDNSTLAV